MSQNARDQILGNIRRGLGRGELSQQAQTQLRERIGQHPRHTIPARGQLDAEGQVALFRSMAEEAAAELIDIDSLEKLPIAVADFLQQNQLKQLLRGSDAALEALDWGPLEGIKVESRPVQAGDPISLTLSFAGIAETGTLMLHSGPNSPTTMNFLTDIHLVALRQSQIVGFYEQAWQQLRETVGENWPRTVNMITGPSRSADIEQRLQMGAHGPKRLVIFMIND
ncbi:hypothetical protein DV711_09590 [Motiliproteus coralliicola]|uniref:LUD domain-containing protein n=1 Tax=Motiliproteus coralliicola TaxID=2283196 RepID=A0A369WTI9_9GAMM|nr:LUD domain-containing protein [Motiliproteus coralliicola]RDE22815.1 hypothetical protein DV711_09590 [Motiliproteus coralliicola]